MRRRTGVIAAASAAAMLIVVGASVAVAASNTAASLGSTDVQLVTPSIKDASGQFYTESQIDTVWSAVTSHYPVALPKGYSFPSTTPAFFHPNDGLNSQFQSGLVDEVAATYWRCDWLAVKLASKKSGDAADVTAAATQLARYSSLPSISSWVNVDAYQASVAQFAKNLGITDLDAAAYQLDCQGLE